MLYTHRFSEYRRSTSLDSESPTESIPRGSPHQRTVVTLVRDLDFNVQCWIIYRNICTCNPPPPNAWPYFFLILNFWVATSPSRSMSMTWPPVSLWAYPCLPLPSLPCLVYSVGPSRCSGNSSQSSHSFVGVNYSCALHKYCTSSSMIHSLRKG